MASKLNNEGTVSPFLRSAAAAAIVLIVAAPAAATRTPAPTCQPTAGLVYVGDDSTPPHEFLDEQGQPAGFTIDLIRALSQEVGVKIDIRLMARGKAIAAIEAGEAQLMHLGHTIEREARFDYLGPVSRVRGSVVLRPGVRPNARGVADLAGLTVAVERDTLTQEMFAQLPITERLKVVTVDSRQEGVKLWARGQVDGMAGSASAVIWLARKAGIFDMVEVPFHHTTFELVTIKGCSAAMSPLATALVSLRARGIVDALSERWLAPRPTESFPWRYVGIAAGVILVMVAAGLAFVWSLRRQVRERTEDLSRALLTQQRLTGEAEVATLAKSAFLATMSHEIRTPLNAVIATASVLERMTLPADQRELVDVIKNGGDSLLSVVSDILDFSKIEAGRLELEVSTFDARALLQSTLGLIDRTAAAKGLQVQVAFDADFPQWVSGDANRLRQVLLNLLSNAVKFTEAGLVRVEASATTGGDDRTTMRIAVSDTGVGIPADRLNCLFEPFTQADSSTTRRFGGTGLGLAISRHLVEAMGGRVAAQSAPGAGSTFTITLPLPVVEPAFAPVKLAAVRPEAHPNWRVLLAEDNAVNQLVERRILKYLGVECDVVSNGREAVDASSRKTYDVVLLDLQMPVMDGFAAATALRRLPRPPWLVAVTADVTTETRQACYAAGFDDYVSKPVTVQDLSEAFDRARLMSGEQASVVA